MAKALTSGATEGQMQKEPYAGKAHEHIPEFSGKAVDYKEYRKRLTLYEKKMSLAKRENETVFNVLGSLKGRAWDACEDLQMDELEAADGMQKILSRLDGVFKYDAITELPTDFENFFFGMHRKRSETIQDYTAIFERNLRKLAAHGVVLPDKVVGWYFLRKANLTNAQKQMIMSTITAATLSLETVRRAVNFVIGQDQTPETLAAPAPSAGRWKRDSIYAAAEDEPWDDADWEDDQIAWEDEEAWLAEDEGAPYYEEETDQILAADDAAAEYDDIMANYVEARQRVNQLKLSRGYFPVVAMVDQQRPFSKGSGKQRPQKGKNKGKKSGGGGKQSSKGSTVKAGGKSALGANKCLRCGRAGHNTDSCPVAAKRKAETDLADINMVADVTESEPINIADDDGVESEPDDTAMFDNGAASVLTGRQQLLKYLKVLMMKGYNVHEIPVWRCTKGFRFGNGNKDVTNLCALVPTFFKGLRRDILMYIINGQAPCLLGRPALAAFGITINHKACTVAWDDQMKFEKAILGPKGEFIVHLAEDFEKIHSEDKRPDQVFLPDDFDGHVFEQVPLQRILQAEDMALMIGDARSEFNEQPQSICGSEFHKEAIHVVEKVFTFEENGEMIPYDVPPEMTAEVEDSQMNSNDKPKDELSVENFSEVTALTTEVTSPSTRPTDSISSSPMSHEFDDSEMSRLTPAKLRKLTYETAAYVKEIHNLFEDAKTIESKGQKPRSKPFVIWEVFAGEGRVTATANRRRNCKGVRFSLQDGWDFRLPAHRKAFIKKLVDEEPDAVLISPPCKLWSQLQELSCAKNPGYRESLERDRQEDHDTILTFTAIVYEIQRRNGREALSEHPFLSKAWKTKAFNKMKGYDAYVDQCQYDLTMPNDDGEVCPVLKPTNFRVTGDHIRIKLERWCPGDHWHTPLEGSVPGLGPRSKLAENYPQELATQIVTAIVQQLQMNDAIFAAEDADAEAGDDANAGEIVEYSPPDSEPEVVPEPVQKNRESRTQVTSWWKSSWLRAALAQEPWSLWFFSFGPNAKRSAGHRRCSWSG